MIINIGIDIIEKKRIKNLLYRRNNKKFLKKILNTNEIKKSNNKKYIEFISKTFSLKESLVKALGTGFRNNITFNKISITNNKLGRPLAKKINKKKILISLSHEKNLTVAIAIIFK